MGIMDIFSRSQPAAIPTQQAATNAPQAAPTNPTAPQAGNPGNLPAQESNPTTPVAPDTTPQGTKSPLDQFSGLWETKPTPGNIDESNNIFNVTPEKFQEAAGKINFSKAVTPEILQKIQAGGDGAAEAMMQAMNSVAQQSFAQSTVAAQKMAAEAIKQVTAKFESDLPGLIKRSQVTSNLRNEHPILKNPAVAPLMGALEQQFTAKYPDSTPEQISQMTKDYLISIGNSITPPAKQDSTASAPADEDWSKFLGT